MTVFRLSTLGFIASSVLALLAFAASTTSPARAAPATAKAAPAEDLYKLCRQVKNDDTVRPYSHALYAGTVKAFKKLFPDAKSAPEESELQTEANYRCMDGKVLTCFIGANLPCAKINTERNNPGAAEYCKTAKNGDTPPMVATGHDALYAYTCQNGKAVVSGTVWALDKRGFAKKLWAEVRRH
jgi:hypothetical protein